MDKKTKSFIRVCRATIVKKKHPQDKMPLRVPLVEYAYFETVSLLAKRLFRLAVYTKRQANARITITLWQS